jgi:hypothetical protein
MKEYKCDICNKVFNKRDYPFIKIELAAYMEGYFLIEDVCDECAIELKRMILLMSKGKQIK